MADEKELLTIGIPKETFPGENRVAVVPALIPLYQKAGMRVLIEAGAGYAAGFTDDQFKAKGGEIVSDRKELFDKSRIILMVRGLGANPDKGQSDLDLFHKDQLLVSFFEPMTAKDEVNKIAAKGVKLFAVEMIPRITRAQSMYALSSMATIAGYKAVLLAAEVLPKMFPMLITAAGTLSPANVFVIGAGVAGLQAIASAKRMGAVVKAYDVRPAVKEQVESLGAKFVEIEIDTADAEDKGGYAKELDQSTIQKQQELMAKTVAESDVVITTAAIPGKKSPMLISGDMVKAMQPGSAIIDLAAERGGNCELTKADERVDINGITILGPTNLPATVPNHASQMYARNLLTLIKNMMKDGELNIDMSDEVTSGTIITSDGDIVNTRIREIFGLEPLPERSAS